MVKRDNNLDNGKADYIRASKLYAETFGEQFPNMLFMGVSGTRQIYMMNKSIRENTKVEELFKIDIEDEYTVY